MIAAMTRISPARLTTVLLVAVWAMVAATLLVVFADAFASTSLTDPDDALRLVQVRDLLAGQPWHDFTQYRINPAGGGGAMHWSRFIDVQIAALILLLQPLLGAQAGEAWALAIYPLVLLLLLLFLLRALLSQLGDETFVRLGLVIAATSPATWQYYVPLRIDHHNWQLLLSLAMLTLAMGRASWWRGLAASLVIAMHLEISQEGLPYLLLFGAIFAWEWLRDPAAYRRLAGFGLGLTVVPLLWLLIWRGPDATFGVYCDAFSMPFWAGAAATGGLLGVAALWPPASTTLLRRLAVLALAGAGGAAVLAALGPQCLAGPFADLEPLVRTYWYEQISEGHPIWEQQADTLGMLVAPLLVGAVGAVWQARRTAAPARPDHHAHANWVRLAMAATGTMVLAVLVLRVTATALTFMVPVAAAMLQGAVPWSRGHRQMLVRVGAAGLLLFTLPLFQMMVGYLIGLPLSPKKAVSAEAVSRCDVRVQLARLANEPPTTLFAAMDIGPALLAHTPHAVVATGHHRNHVAMNQVITGFFSAPARAEAVVRATGAGMVVLCDDNGEAKQFVDEAPAGLGAALVAGRAPTWLEPLPHLSTSTLRVYRVRPAAGQP